ncbi:MAG: TRL-like family protein [Methylococcaceae bacterium]
MLKKITFAVVVVGLLAGCAQGLSPVGTGLITDVKGPITATGATGSKTGTACANTILGLINEGDASIEAAKAAGGISVVASADYHTQGFYPFVGETCVIVTGQ